MDKQFLEFWGKYLLAAAKGQKQMEELNHWIRQGFKGFDDWTAEFKKFYGFEHSGKEATEALKGWENGLTEFRNYFKAYLNLMAMVPKDEYQALEKKYAELQKKVAEQENTIDVLRRLLAEEGTYQGETVKVFQDLVNKQADAFENLIRNLTTAADNQDEQKSS